MASCGACAVPSSAANTHGGAVDGGHRRACYEAKMPFGNARPTMQTKDRIGWEAAEQSVLQQSPRPSANLLGGLEDQMQRASKLTRLSQASRRSEQDCGMSIMPAGVHDIRFFAPIFEARRLVNR
jgi:hypothetical protein